MSNEIFFVLEFFYFMFIACMYIKIGIGNCDSSKDNGQVFLVRLIVKFIC